MTTKKTMTQGEGDRERGEEAFLTDRTPYVLGPYHPALPGPMRIALELEGERIARAQVETGFLHKNLEKAFERNPWRSSLVYAERLDPVAPLSGGLVLCLAVEETGEISVPERGQRIRLILAELSRVLVHLKFIAKMARAAGLETMMHYVLRDSEKILDLFELLTGSRYAKSYLRFGGVQADATAGFLERVHELCDLLRIRTKEYNDLFSFNFCFVQRATRVGTLDLSLAEKCGVTGPNGRASGSEADVRKSRAYLSYDHLDFKVPKGGGFQGRTGDVYARYLIRLREILQSLEILKQAIDNVPAGDFLNSKAERDFSIPRGEASCCIESPRGLLGCHVVSDGGINPSRVQFHPPTRGHVDVIPELLRGNCLEDLALILASLDLGISELDR
jgi:NADH-quinone oxidoreductase subunit D